MTESGADGNYGCERDGDAAKHCESDARRRERAVRLAGRRDLAADHVEELLDRIDAEREAGP